MSACDPKRTLLQFSACPPSPSHSAGLGSHYYGDNLQVLRDSIATESVDLIYLDPPFMSIAT